MSKPNPNPIPSSAPALPDGARRRFNVSVPIEYRESDDENAPVKTWWQQLGVAFEHAGKDGKPPSIAVILNALPVGSADGRARFRLFLDDDSRRRERGSEGRDRAAPDVGDDGIPF